MTSPHLTWAVRSLGDVLEVQNGFAFDSSLFTQQGGIPLIRIRDLRDGTRTNVLYSGEHHPDYVVRSGDYLIGMDGEFRCYEWRGPDALLNQRVCRLRNFAAEVLPEFIYLGLNHHLREIESRTAFSTVKHLSSKTINAIRMAFPPLEVQRQIVASVKECLGRAHEAKALRAKNAADLSSLEASAFADCASTLAHDQFVPLGDLLTNAQYGSSTRANSDGRGVPILRMGNLQDGVIDAGNIKHVELPPSEVAKYRLRDGDVLFNRTNSLELVGKAATFRDLPGEWVFASYLVRLVVDEERALPEYVTAVINSRIGRQFILQTARRAIGMVNVNAKDIQRLMVPLPSMEKQRAIVGVTLETRDRARKILEEYSLDSLDLLPDAILARAFHGEAR